jgi:hypothetical protein
MPHMGKKASRETPILHRIHFSSICTWYVSSGEHMIYFLDYRPDINILSHLVGDDWLGTRGWSEHTMPHTDRNVKMYVDLFQDKSKSNSVFHNSDFLAWSVCLVAFISILPQPRELNVWMNELLWSNKMMFWTCEYQILFIPFFGKLRSF